MYSHDYGTLLQVLLTDMSNFDSVNKVYKQYFTTEPLPARICYAVKQLPVNASVEIDAIAVSKSI